MTVKPEEKVMRKKATDCLLGGSPASLWSCQGKPRKASVQIACFTEDKRHWCMRSTKQVVQKPDPVVQCEKFKTDNII